MRVTRSRPVALVLLLIAVLLGGVPAAAAPDAAPSLTPWAQLDDQWGPWLPERLWGTPREATGTDGWALDWEAAITTDYRTFDDGIAGWTDRAGRYRLGWAFWDGIQPHVTERFAGDTNPEGVAGETITDDRVFGDTGPTSSYAAMTVTYPALERTFLIDLEGGRLDDRTLLFRARVTNRSDAPATLHLLLKGSVAPGGTVTAAKGGLTLQPAADAGEDLVIASPDLDGWQASDDKGAIDANLRAGGLDRGRTGRIGALGTTLALAPGASQDVVAWAYERNAGAFGSPSATRQAIAAALDQRRDEIAELYLGEVAVHEDLYRQALMSLLWARSLYRWDGVTGMDTRLAGTVAADDVLIMPDKWEYPWLASWDAAFHAVTAAVVDPALGAAELRFLLSPRWQTPEGHIPCGEWVMTNECPPLFAWAALEVADAGAGDALLAELYPALQAHHAFWWSRLQVKETRLFRGGFMGMDNLPGRSIHAQADSSGWMAMFSRDLAAIARRLGKDVDAAGYLAQRDEIAAAVNASLWDETAGFYFDATDSKGTLLPLVSYSGLVPLIADIVPPERVARLMARLTDPAELLSPAGIRSVTASAPEYIPGSAGRGVNSNWRGPVWMPNNLLLARTLQGIDPTFAQQLRERLVGAVATGWQETGRLWEFYDGDTGAGLGADAQTGWTAAVALILRDGWMR